MNDSLTDWMGHPATWDPYVTSPFSNYIEMISFLLGLQRDNDDATILIDGLEGAGKSTVGFKLARHLDPNWTPETGLIIDFEDWENLYSLERGKVFLLDEGGDLLFSRDSQKGENKLVVRMFQMARIFNHIIIILCPNIHWVDLYIRDHRALIYGHVHKSYHATGVHRGLVTWNWPKRYFDWEKSEWTCNWNEVNNSRFKPVVRDQVWNAYEELKKQKTRNRQMDLGRRLKR